MGPKKSNLDLQLAELHKRLLHKKLAEVVRLLGLTGLDSAWVVTPDEFSHALERCDVALDSLSGVTREVRRLVWLNEVLESMAAEMKGRPWVAGQDLKIPLRALQRFTRESLAEIPPRARAVTPPGIETRGRKKAGPPKSPANAVGPPAEEAEDRVVVRFLGQYVAACAATGRPGRPRRGKRAIPEKWLAFRDLADHLGLVSGTIPVDTLRRTVLRGRQKLKAAEQLRLKV